MLLDSNVIIDAAKPSGAHLSVYLTHPKASISVVSRIEPLGFHRLSAIEDLKSKIHSNYCRNCRLTMT